MSMGMRRWSINDFDKEDIIKLSEAWKVPEICAAILYCRGFKDEKQVSDFINFSEFVIKEFFWSHTNSITNFF